MNHDTMTEAELRAIKAVMDRDIAQLRAENRHVEVRELRGKIIALKALIDARALERMAEQQRIAAKATSAQSVNIEGEVAAAISEVERILGG